MQFRFLLLALAYVLLSTTYVYAQTPSAQNRPPAPMSEQEFRTKINSIADEDSVLELYFQYAFGQARRSPDVVNNLADELLESEEFSTLKKNAYSNYLKAIYWDRPDPDSTIKYLQLAEQQFDELGQYQRVVGHIINQARANNRLNNFLESERLYYKAIGYIDENKLTEEERRRVINEMSDLYIRLGAVEIALVRLTELLEMGPETIDEECRIRLKISNARKSNSEIDEAVNQLAQCVDSGIANIPLQVAILRSLSDLERIRGNQEERLHWIERATEFNTPDPTRNLPTNLFLAQAYFDNEMFSKTDSVIAEMENLDLRRIQAPTIANLAVLKTKNSLRVGDATSAIRNADQGLQATERMPGSLIALDLQRLKAEAYELDGNFEEAYSLLKGMEDRERLFEEMGRIREEEQSKVRFQLRATNDQLEEVSTQLDIVRLRTFFIVLLVLFLSGFLVYRSRILGVLKEEKTRNKIASDLHDEVSATLTGISFFAEAIKKDKDPKKQKHFMDLITESAGDAKEKISDIVWSITPENDDWEKFLSKCRRYASDLLESKEVQYELKIAESVSGKLDMYTRQNLWMIFKEILTNIVRHSNADRVDIIIDTEGPVFKIVMQDDGIGFNPESETFGNGLKNISNRAKSIGARISLDSEPKMGTRWRLELDV